MDGNLLLKFFIQSLRSVANNIRTVLARITATIIRARYHVIQNAEEWAEICKKCFPPEINFSNTIVIAVFTSENLHQVLL